MTQKKQDQYLTSTNYWVTCSMQWLSIIPGSILGPWLTTSPYLVTRWAIRGNVNDY
jgi:hypothetical protein